jgi:small subunit ribosomal protein S21
VQVLVRDNNVDQALRALKKKLQREGVFREMKLRDHYEKPSEKRAREKAEAVRRARKVARKRAQRDGLLRGNRVAGACSPFPSRRKDGAAAGRHALSWGRALRASRERRGSCGFREHGTAWL